MPSEEDRATASGNMHKKLVTFGRTVLELCERTDRRTDGRTDKQTDILITILSLGSPDLWYFTRAPVFQPCLKSPGMQLPDRPNDIPYLTKQIVRTKSVENLRRSGNVFWIDERRPKSVLQPTVWDGRLGHQKLLVSNTSGLSR